MITRWGGVYKEIEAYMDSKNLQTLGEVGTLADDDPAASCDLPMEERALRTMFVRRLTDYQLLTLHEFEWRKLKRLVISHGECKSIIKFIDKKVEAMNDERMAYVIYFNNQNRPIPEKIDGISIPAYFPPNYNFHGM